MITDYLQNKPIIGAIVAIVGPGVGFLSNVLTADTTIRAIGICSVYIGFFVGLLTGIIKIIELLNLARKK